MAKAFAFVYLRYVGNYADSIELAQETFVRAYHHRSRFNFKSKFSTWLLTIATNLCKHHARWRKRHPTISLDDTAGIDEMFDEYLHISAEDWDARQRPSKRGCTVSVSSGQEAFPGSVVIFDFQIHNGTDPGESVGKDPEQGAIAESGVRGRVDRVKKPLNFTFDKCRRFAFGPRKSLGLDFPGRIHA
jgi:RNA polymerase sigma factor (sigma-70 family)